MFGHPAALPDSEHISELADAGVESVDGDLAPSTGLQQLCQLSNILGKYRYRHSSQMLFNIQNAVIISDDSFIQKMSYNWILNR